MSLFRPRKSIEEIGLLSGIEDCHSHILPGVDDGIPTIEESLATLDIMEKAGIKKLWLTPHIMEEYPNTTLELKSIFDELKQNYKGNIELLLASENMIDPLFEERLKKEDFLPIGERGDKLLVETSFFSAPFTLYDILDKIKATGLTPVLAHPERFVYMNIDTYDRLKSMGVHFQVNYTSFSEFNGKTAAEKARTLLDLDYLDYCGGDTHKARYFEKAITSKKLDKKLIEKLKDTFVNKTI